MLVPASCRDDVTDYHFPTATSWLDAVHDNRQGTMLVTKNVTAPFGKTRLVPHGQTVRLWSPMLQYVAQPCHMARPEW